MIEHSTIEHPIDFNLLDALQQLNWKHGKGRIEGYRLDSEDDDNRRATGIAYRRIPVTQKTSRSEARRFRVVRNTVYFLGHQQKISG